MTFSETPGYIPPEYQPNQNPDDQPATPRPLSRRELLKGILATAAVGADKLAQSNISRKIFNGESQNTADAERRVEQKNRRFDEQIRKEVNDLLKVADPAKVGPKREQKQILDEVLTEKFAKVIEKVAAFAKNNQSKHKLRNLNWSEIRGMGYAGGVLTAGALELARVKIKEILGPDMDEFINTNRNTLVAAGGLSASSMAFADGVLNPKDLTGDSATHKKYASSAVSLLDYHLTWGQTQKSMIDPVKIEEWSQVQMVNGDMEDKFKKDLGLNPALDRYAASYYLLAHIKGEILNSDGAK